MTFEIAHSMQVLSQLQHLATNMSSHCLRFLCTLEQFLHCLEKVNPTVYHRNVQAVQLTYFCTLDAEVFCEICTKFHEKMMSGSRVVNLYISIIKYFGFEYSILQSLSDVVLTQSCEQ